MQVDFYQLSRHSAAETVPLLVSKVIASGQRALVLAREDALLDRIGTALWKAGPTAFLAHGRAGEPHAARQPVLLSRDAEAGAGAENGAQVLLVADGVWPESADAFSRALLLFEAGDAAPARALWKTLTADEAHTARIFKQDGRGRWKEGG